MSKPLGVRRTISRIILDLKADGRTTGRALGITIKRAVESPKAEPSATGPNANTRASRD